MKKLFSLILVTFCFIQLQAQEIYNSTGRNGSADYRKNKSKSGFDPQRLIIGGGLGAGFSNSGYLISVNPDIGYRITDRFSAGIQLGYNLNSHKFNVFNTSTGNYQLKPFNASAITTGVWARFLLFENFFTQIDFEYNFMKYTGYQAHNILGIEKYKENYQVPSLLLGVGYRSRITERVSIILMARYDVLQTLPSNIIKNERGEKIYLSPYANTIDLRIGVAFGF